MICTSFRPPLFNGKVQKAHECLCCLCHHGTVYHDFENEHQMVVRRPDASQGKHLVQRPDIFINAIVHTLLYLDMIQQSHLPNGNLFCFPKVIFKFQDSGFKSV